MIKKEIEEINKAYDDLPDSLKEIFDSQETAQALMGIGKKYSLHVDQLGELVTLVHYVILGILDQRDFAPELKSQAGIPGDLVNLIIYDVNQQILSKVRQEMEELSRRTLANQSIEQAPSTPQVFAEKMQGVANVPKQEVAVTPQTRDNKVRDPYREPI